MSAPNRRNTSLLQLRRSMFKVGCSMFLLKTGGWNNLFQTVFGTTCPKPAKRITALVITFLCLLATPSPAIIDTNTNGVSDLWEKQYNNGNFFTGIFDLNADPDFDGWSNETEAAAGTNPFNQDPAGGFIRPEISKIPALYGEENGHPVVITPESMTIIWPVMPGKQYTLQFSLDLTAGSWLPVGNPFIAGVYNPIYGFPIAESSRCFWRVKVNDVDTDGDGVTDAEEAQLGSIPSLFDADHDGVNDQDEINLYGSSPLTGDSDSDGADDSLEIRSGTDPSSPDSQAPLWKSVARDINYVFYSIINSEGIASYGNIWYSKFWGDFAITQERITSPILIQNLATTLENEIPYPEEIPEITESLLQSGGYASTGPLDVYGHPAPEGLTYVVLHQKRVWLQVRPAATEPITLKCLKLITRPIPERTVEPISSILSVTIPAGSTQSNAVDLDATFLTNGNQGNVGYETFDQSIIPVDIEIRKKNEDPPPNGLLAKTSDVLELGISKHALQMNKTLNSAIYWEFRKLKNDKTYGMWRYLGDGTKCEYTFDDAGIYQVKATYLLTGEEFFYTRRKNEVLNGFQYGPGLKGERDVIGICDSQIQINLCRESQKFYGSTAYESTVTVPAQYGFPEILGSPSSIRCNFFVAHRGAAVGAVVPKINGWWNEYPPLANEWAGIEDTSIIPGDSTYIQRWPILPIIQDPQPGWIIAHPAPNDAGHCAIIDYDGEGIGAGESGTVNKQYDEFWDGSSRYRKYAP